MLESDDSVPAEVRILNLPDLACYQSFQELLLSLPTWLQVLVPVTVTNVIVSNTEPSASQVNYVWFRRNNAGTILGIYLYSNGAWNQFFPAPGQVFTLAGDPTSPPVGYVNTDNSITLTAPQKTFFKNQWRSNGSGGYDVYTAVVEGQ